MQDSTESVLSVKNASLTANQTVVASHNNDALSDQYKVIRRNNKVTSFDKEKIKVALGKAFLAVEGGNAAASTRIHQTVETLTNEIYSSLIRSRTVGSTFHIEDIQDQVELSLMRAGEHKVARAYVLYRESHSAKRSQEDDIAETEDHGINVKMKDGSLQPLDVKRIKTILEEACEGLESTNAEDLVGQTIRNLYDGVKEKEISSAMIMCTRVMIEQEPNYSFVTSRLLLDTLRQEALSFVYGRDISPTQNDMKKEYPEYFKQYIKKAASLELLDTRLAEEYDLERLSKAIKPERDFQFNYLGLQTLYDRYFIHNNEIRFEMPQAFFMRVSMGLAINEINREERTIEFYNLLSSFDFMSSTPTLFNSGTLRPQMSSCYLTTIPDDLHGIFESMQDDAMLSKFAGGLGNDWTRVRAMGSHIKGTNGKSQGIVPFLKVANDIAVAVNQGGKRKGAMCAYLETWHLDIEDFLDLRKNTGDERRRTHDMNSANWIPDLFMKRVSQEKDWTLFSPEAVPELHDLYGQAFEEKYKEYEKLAAEGKITLFKTIPANDLWRKMLGMLFETGHPWIAFKDPCNIRSPQKHAGVVHSSNLCTEITLNTSDSEIAVCNLGSINLPQHINENGLDTKKLQRTIKTAMRMLDNVVDYNYYAVNKARNSNLRHRPIGIGLMGFQDALYKQKIAYASEEAIQFADYAMECISYYAIDTSADLAQERGSYESFNGSLWSQGIMPLDTLDALEKSRDGFLSVDKSSQLDWDSVRAKAKQGMRNSNTMAIAPTATISNICGVSQSIEPTYQNMYVKSNLSGEFTVVNPYLVKDLKDAGIWDQVMVNDLKYFDGSVQSIERVSDELKAIYLTAFEIDPRWLVESGARRQKWIDQSQSLNLYMAEPSGKKLDNLYKLAWVRGLKTTYYLRSMGATGIEKQSTNPDIVAADTVEAPKMCSILDPECDACQ
jgi:ribonucleoside-diphosphate reductase alpha chain